MDCQYWSLRWEIFANWNTCIPVLRLSRLRLPGYRCSQTNPLLKRLYYLSALPLRGRQALRHLADLSDSSGSDSPRGAPDQAVLSVGCSEGCGGWVVPRGGVGVSPCDLHRDVVLDRGATLFSRPLVWENGASGLPVKTDGVTTPQKISGGGPVKTA